MSKHTHAAQQSIPPVPDPLADKNGAVAALGALYQGEKTDASYVFSTAMAMMGVAVAYLVGAIPFVERLSHEPIEPLAWLFLLIIPIPLWLVAAFQSLMTLTLLCQILSGGFR